MTKLYIRLIRKQTGLEEEKERERIESLKPNSKSMCKYLQRLFPEKSLKELRNFKINSHPTRSEMYESMMMPSVHMGNLKGMLDAYIQETDELKKSKMQHFMHDYLVTNHGMKCDCDGGEYTVKSYTDRLNAFYDYEKNEIEKTLKNITIDKNDLALVSVDCKLSDTLSPCTKTALEQIRYEFQRSWYSGNAGFPFFEMEYDCQTRVFKKGDIWELAILSKDKKSFILVRDLLDKKIQPIENCIQKQDGKVLSVLNENSNSFTNDVFVFNTNFMHKQADNIIARDPLNVEIDYKCRVPQFLWNEEDMKNYVPLDAQNVPHFGAPLSSGSNSTSSNKELDLNMGIL